MKRFHVHVAVEDLAASVDFYSKLFGHPPSKQQPDYAKWMLADPRLNFAISKRGHTVGVNHFGFQVDTPQELAALEELAQSASADAVLQSAEASCCYAQSKKHWTIDPQGLAWEHFHTLSDAVTFGDDSAAPGGACCIPLRASPQDRVDAGCCVPGVPGGTAQASCCA